MNVNSFVKPNLFISKCIGFANCRWNGGIIYNQFVEKLKRFVNAVTICPECEINLGVPREPLRIVYKNNAYHLFQPDTNKDFTDQMNAFVTKYVKTLQDIDGFILKDRSPSCGIKDVNVYSEDQAQILTKTAGFFGKKILESFPYSAIETEMRLNNLEIREHFLTKVFTYARFREVFKSKKINQLIEFHTENKFLLMLYSQKELKIMGNVIANYKSEIATNVFKSYQNSLQKALLKKPKFTSAINVLMHIFGYFKKFLTSQEKKFFLKILEEYRNKQVPLSVPVKLLQAYVIRYNQNYIAKQTFFEPFPKELLQIESKY